MLKIRSYKTGLVNQVTEAELKSLQAVAGKHAFEILEKDTTPEEVKAAKSKAPAATSEKEAAKN